MGERHLFNQISDRALHLHLHDLRNLRGRYRNLNVDTPTVTIQKMQRKDLVNCILREEFGRDNLKLYMDQVQVWEECRKFVEQ